MNHDIYQLAYSNDAAGIRAALAHGANPNEPHPRAGTLPLQLACQANALDALRELLECGANADAVFTFASRVSERVIEGRTALMSVQSCVAARMLLKAGADVNRVDSMGWSAVAHAAHGANVDVVELLLSEGADALVKLWYDGKELSLLEFVEYRCAYLDANARELRQPQASETLEALRRVGQAIERSLHT